MLFNNGIENLMEKEEGIYEAIEELMKGEKYYECFDLVSYYLCEKAHNKQGKFGYFKNFMSEGFGNFLRGDNNNEEEENNNIRQQVKANSNEKGN